MNLITLHRLLPWHVSQVRVTSSIAAQLREEGMSGDTLEGDSLKETANISTSYVPKFVPTPAPPTLMSPPLMCVF